MRCRGAVPLGLEKHYCIRWSVNETEGTRAVSRLFKLVIEKVSVRDLVSDASSTSGHQARAGKTLLHPFNWCINETEGTLGPRLPLAYLNWPSRLIVTLPGALYTFFLSYNFIRRFDHVFCGLVSLSKHRFYHYPSRSCIARSPIGNEDPGTSSAWTWM